MIRPPQGSLHESLYRTVARHFPRGVVGLFDTGLRLVLLDGSEPFPWDGTAPPLGRHPAEFAPPGEIAKLEIVFRDALAGHHGHAEVHHRGRVIEVDTYPVRDELGAVAMGLVMTCDVTEARALQERLQAASRLAALGALVKELPHEINNPLAVAVSHQEAALQLCEELVGALQSAAPPARDAVMAQVEEIAQMIRTARSGEMRVARVVRDLVLSSGAPRP